MSLELLNSPANFEDLKDANCYFVDKTEYLKTILADSSSVLLFIRPSGFGKTMLMTMFESFLQINSEKPFDNSKQLELFKGTKILEDKEFCSKFMGQYPVVYINLKAVEGNDFDEAYRNFASTVFTVASRYHYLLDSHKLDESDKEEIKNLTTKSYLLQLKHKISIKDSLRTLATALYKEYGKYPILLIDEYDVPLKRAAYHDNLNKKLHENEKGFRADYHYKMETLMSGFFGILKDKKTTTKIIMTGGLRVYKNRLYSGMNFIPNCVDAINEDYTGMFGFTEDDTLKLLKDYGLDDCYSKVKEHYAGYKFFDKEIFNPVDVVSFVKNNFEQKQHGSEIKTDTYWCDLVADNDIELNENLDNLSGYSNQRIQDLVDGKHITFKLNDSMNYDILLEDNTDDILSLLLHKGYLTIDWDATDALDEISRRNKVCAKLPNLEIRDHLIKTFQERFSSEFVMLNLHTKLVDALSCGNQKEAYNILFDMLQKYVSIRDTATKAPLENYYLGFINDIFTSCEDIISEYHSNNEAGNGYSDITFKAEHNTKAVIIEIKATSNDVEMDELATDALSQIEEKNYALPFTKQSKITEIYAYGLVFCKKDCLVVCRKLK